MVIERLDLACAGDPPVRPSPATHSPGCEVRHDPRRRQRARERAGRSRPGALSESGQLAAPLSRDDPKCAGRRYDASFVNEFIPEGEGMRYRLTASVRLKWPYRLTGPFVKPLVVARMRRYVVEPLKVAAESEHYRRESRDAALNHTRDP